MENVEENVDTELKHSAPVEDIDAIREYVIPFYKGNDPAHQIDHADNVHSEMLYIAETLELDSREKYLAEAAAYFHDMHASERDEHHTLAAKHVRTSEDEIFNQFTKDERETIAQACAEHRASYTGIYHNEISEYLSAADRGKPDLDGLIRRSMKYQKYKFPKATEEERRRLVYEYLHDKYGSNGYIKYPPPYYKVYAKELAEFVAAVDRLPYGTVEEQFDMNPGDKDPVKIKLMEVKSFANSNGLMEVTSAFIKDPATNMFHEDGLYSETIFGEVASKERQLRMGIIRLNTTVLHPKVFMTLMRMRGLYRAIISGSEYAVFKKQLGDFELAAPDDKDAGTGYAFFMKHLGFIKLRNDSGSLIRKENIRLLKDIESHKVSLWPVIPAGIRDYKEDAKGRGESDDINKLYVALLNYSKQLANMKSTSPVVDPVRYRVQNKLVEIYKYIKNMMDDKGGILQSHYGARAVAYGTRNVLSTHTVSDLDIDDPKFFDVDDIRLGLEQAAAGLRPLVKHYLKSFMFSYIMTGQHVPAIDKKTRKLVYIEADHKYVDLYTSSEGLDKFVDMFSDEANRTKPVVIRDTDDKEYYMLLQCIVNDELHLFRNTSEWEGKMNDNDKEFNSDDIRPITLGELLYIVTSLAARDKYADITRYPVAHDGSTYTAKIKLASTSNPKTLYLMHDNAVDKGFLLAEYPNIDEQFIASSSVHPSCLKPLGGDYDGDTISVNPRLSVDANEEAKKYMDSLGHVVGPNGKLRTGLSTDLGKLTIYNLTRDN